MKMDWFYYAIIAMISLSIVFILIRKLCDIGLDSGAIFFYNTIMAAVIMVGYIFINRTQLKTSTTGVIILVVLALFLVLGNIFLIKAIATAPNPGYALAINSVQVLIVAVAAIFLFKSEFTFIKAAGALLAVIGVILLGL